MTGRVSKVFCLEAKGSQAPEGLQKYEQEEEFPLALNEVLGSPAPPATFPWHPLPPAEIPPSILDKFTAYLPRFIRAYYPNQGLPPRYGGGASLFFRHLDTPR